MNKLYVVPDCIDIYMLLACLMKMSFDVYAKQIRQERKIKNETFKK